MYKIINSSYELEKEFIEYGRGKQFTRGGFDLLFNYFEILEEEIEEPFVLDVIGICCEWTETTVENCLQHTGYTLEELAEATVVLQDDDTLIYMNF